MSEDPAFNTHLSKRIFSEKNQTHTLTRSSKKEATFPLISMHNRNIVYLTSCTIPKWKTSGWAFRSSNYWLPVLAGRNLGISQLQLSVKQPRKATAFPPSHIQNETSAMQTISFGPQGETSEVVPTQRMIIFSKDSMSSIALVLTRYKVGIGGVSRRQRQLKFAEKTSTHRHIETSGHKQHHLILCNLNCNSQIKQGHGRMPFLGTTNQN